MLFENNIAEAELLNGYMVDIYFDFDYTPGFTAKHSGTSMAEEPDEPEEYEIVNIRIETFIGELVKLSDEDKVDECPKLKIADTEAVFPEGKFLIIHTKEKSSFDLFVSKLTSKIEKWDIDGVWIYKLIK